MSNPYANPHASGDAVDLSEMIQGDVRGLQIVTGALAQGAIVVAVMFFFLEGFDLNNEPDLLSGIGLGGAALSIVLHIVVPKLVLRVNLNQVDRQAYASANLKDRVPMVLGPLRSAHIVSCALLEGAAMLNLVAYLIDGWVGSLGVAAVLVVLILFKMPTVSGISHRIENVMQEMEL